MMDDNEIQNDCFYCLACDTCDKDVTPTSETILWVATLLVALCTVGAVFL